MKIIFILILIVGLIIIIPLLTKKIKTFNKKYEKEKEKLLLLKKRLYKRELFLNKKTGEILDENKKTIPGLEKVIFIKEISLSENFEKLPEFIPVEVRDLDLCLWNHDYEYDLTLILRN